MPHSYPINEIKKIMALPKEELDPFLSSIPYAFKKNGIIQVYGQAQHLPHIRLQVFLALMRQGKISRKIKLQPYLYALIVLHVDWLRPLRRYFFPKSLALTKDVSKIKVALYLKMGGGYTWTSLREEQLGLLPTFPISPASNM